MAPIIRNAMPADDLDLQRYVAPGDVATIGATDAKTIEHQDSFQPSLAQNSDKNANNKWFQDMALNPSHIEIQPTTLASLNARDLGPDNEPNAINCNSFGIRGGRRCQTIGDDIKSRLRKNHGQRYSDRPKLNLKQDGEPKLARRERNKKGFESHPCEIHATGGGCSKISSRDRDIDSKTLSRLDFIDTVTRAGDTVQDPSKTKFRSMLGEHKSIEEARNAVDAHQAALRNRARVRQTATAVGISVGVVVGVFLLGLLFWFLRKRSKKLAAKRAEGRVAELELETRRKGDVHGEQAGKC